MGFFSKKKITIVELANSLTDLALESISEKSLANYSKLLKDMNRPTRLDFKQKQELLIFQMLSIVKGVENVYRDKTKVRIILDLFHDKVFERLVLLGIEKGFSQKVVDRYKEYNKIFSDYMDSGNAGEGMKFGGAFSKNFIGKDLKGEALVMSLSSFQIFMKSMLYMNDFSKKVKNDYELVI